eukprot:403653-Rhodomonas_salina.6
MYFTICSACSPPPPKQQKQQQIIQTPHTTQHKTEKSQQACSRERKRRRKKRGKRGKAPGLHRFWRWRGGRRPRASEPLSTRTRASSRSETPPDQAPKSHFPAALRDLQAAKTQVEAAALLGWKRPLQLPLQGGNGRFPAVLQGIHVALQSFRVALQGLRVALQGAKGRRPSRRAALEAAAQRHLWHAILLRQYCMLMCQYQRMAPIRQYRRAVPIQQY